LIVRSEEFDNASWTKNELTITANNAISPDGTQNADTALETTANAYHDILNTSTSLTLNTNYTLSCFVKYAGREYMYLFVSDGVAAAAVKFNVQTGVVLGTALGTVVSSKIENYGNGWYRCSMVYTASVSVTATIAISTTNSPALSLATYSGDVTKGISVWGAQFEASSYPTSYIPTTSASATRVADACYKTGISSLIGQTEGVMFVDFVFNGYMESIEEMSLSVNTSNRIGMYTFDGTNTLRGYIVASGAVPFENNFIALTLGQRYKVAFAYKSGDCVVYINGVNVFGNSSTFSFGATMDAFKFSSSDNTSQFYKPINQAVLFKTRLTNAELASLTTI
jgi:hypothetical protein